MQDRGEHVGQLGADHEQPFLIGLGRCDVQQRDELAGGWQLVLDQAVMGELCELFNPDAGMAENFRGRPGPERVVFLAGEVAPGAGGVVGPDPLGLGGQDGAAHGLPGCGELLAGSGVARGGQQGGGSGAGLVEGGGQGGDHGEAFPGPLVHA